MTEPRQSTTSQAQTQRLTTRPKVPCLPSEVISLIIAHYIGPYTLRITYAWWDFDSNIRIHNIPPTDSLTLVSRTFNNIVQHQLRLAFSGCLKIDHDAAENMHHYQRRGAVAGTVSSDGSSTSKSSPSSSSTSLDSASTHLNWLFDNIHTVQIVGYLPTRVRPYIVDMRHWPALERVELLLRVYLLPYMREITMEQHDEEVLSIAEKVARTMKLEGVRGGGEVKVGFVFESCRCGIFCLVRAKEGQEDGFEILHSREEWIGERVRKGKVT